MGDIPWGNCHSRSNVSNWWLSTILTHVLKWWEAVSGNSNILICCWWCCPLVWYAFLWKAMGVKMIRLASLESPHPPEIILQSHQPPSSRTIPTGALPVWILTFPDRDSFFENSQGAQNTALPAADWESAAVVSVELHFCHVSGYQARPFSISFLGFCSACSVLCWDGIPVAQLLFQLSWNARGK